MGGEGIPNAQSEKGDPLKLTLVCGLPQITTPTTGTILFSRTKKKKNLDYIVIKA